MASVLAAAVAAVLAFGGAAPAVASGNGSAPGALTTNNLVISQNAAGAISVVQGSVLQAGPVVQAQFSSVFTYTDASGKVYNADPEIFQLHNDATLVQVDTKIAEAGQGGATAAAAIQWFLANTTFYGGLPDTSSNRFDLILPPGKYYVAQLQPVPPLNLKPSNTAKTFSVVGSPQATQPYANQVLTVVNTNGPDLFSAYSVTYGTSKLHNGTITITNKTGSITSPPELHFFQWRQVQSGTTSQQVCNWYTAGGPSPLVSGGGKANFGTLSSQRAVRAHLNVPVGRYLVSSNIPDGNTGKAHSAQECEFALVDVVA